MSVERIFVHADVAGPFLDALCAQANEWAGQIGPMVDRTLREDVHRQVTESVAAGARLRTGGELPDGAGAFYPPTVLEGASGQGFGFGFGPELLDEMTTVKVVHVEPAPTGP